MLALVAGAVAFAQVVPANRLLGTKLVWAGRTSVITTLLALVDQTFDVTMQNRTVAPGKDLGLSTLNESVVTVDSFWTLMLDELMVTDPFEPLGPAVALRSI